MKVCVPLEEGDEKIGIVIKFHGGLRKLMIKTGGQNLISEIFFILFVVGLLVLIILGYRQRIREQDIMVDESIDRINRVIEDYNRKNK